MFRQSVVSGNLYWYVVGPSVMNVGLFAVKSRGCGVRRGEGSRSSHPSRRWWCLTDRHRRSSFVRRLCALGLSCLSGLVPVLACARSYSEGRGPGLSSGGHDWTVHPFQSTTTSLTDYRFKACDRLNRTTAELAHSSLLSRRSTSTHLCRVPSIVASSCDDLNARSGATVTVLS